MRILLWYWGRRGGGAQHALCLARALRLRRDVALSLSVSSHGELAAEFAALGADLVPTFAGATGFLAAHLRLPGLVRRLRRQSKEVDVVISVMSHVWTPFVAPFLSAPFVPIVHDGRPHPGDSALLWHWRLRRELLAARAAIVLSESVGRLVLEHTPDLPLVRQFLGAHRTQGPADTASGRDVLFFGRMRAYKGLDLLRDAWTEVIAARPDAKLRVVGEGDAEALAPGLRALPGVTIDSGWVPEAALPALIAGAGAVVLPYREASQSGVLPLAIAAGVPVVATTVDGLAEQLRDGQGGLLVPPNPTAIAAALLRVMDPTQASALVAAGAAEAARLSDWDAQAADLVAALRELGL